MKSEIEMLKSAIKKRWSGKPSDKAKRYLDQFFNCECYGLKIVGEVEGNHGEYTVSIQLKEKDLVAACSCYIGKDGFCHHCSALGRTFISKPSQFKKVKRKPVKSIDRIKDLDELENHLRSQTLEEIMIKLKAKGITQKAFAECVGMSSRHLSSVKSSENRNRFYNELGVIKLAALWVLENIHGSGKKG